MTCGLINEDKMNLINYKNQDEDDDDVCLPVRFSTQFHKTCLKF